MTTRAFDLIVYGATGFTGRLVAEYLVQQYGTSGPRWAMAGRSAAKLAEVRDLIGAPADTPLIVADADDPASLAAMAGQTRVLITTVGPYALYGEGLVAACVAAGTDYADLCGEPLWMRDMIDRYHAAAQASGARITLSCGFDSIPFELGVVMLQQACLARFGAPAPCVKGRMRSMQGSFSGGTAASLKATMASIARDPSLLARMIDPFALTPGFTGPEQPRDSVRFDTATGSWAAPFIMAPINTKNVHRSNLLLDHAWGAGFVYDELLLTGPGDAGEAAAKSVSGSRQLGTAKDLQPGEGPGLQERESGFYDLLVIGEMADGRSLRLGVKGKRDPGYGSTSRMISETAMALHDCQAPGGVWVPGALLGQSLAQRLEAHADITFRVEEG